MNTLRDRNDYSNISSRIEEKIGKGLHNQPNHPIEIIKRRICDFNAFAEFKKVDDLSPVVSVENNFEKLLIKPDHPSRSKSDTYYVNEHTVLRTHTSAHESEILATGARKFLVTGDVYRKDEIDRSHYPVFHQTEGVCVMEQGCTTEECAKELVKCITGLVEWLFPGCESRVNPDYFPFTNPSFEVEVKYRDEWLEVLGCGVLESEIMKNNGLEGHVAWAFGLGLERLAMIMFEIPDIRLFWCTHPRFLEQFKSGDIERIRFRPFSKLSSKSMDISFFIPIDNMVQIYEIQEGIKVPNLKWNQENDFFELVRDISNEWIERVELKDSWFHPKREKHSRMYRLWYLPNDPDLKSGGEFKDIVNHMQNELRSKLESAIDVELR